MVSFIFLPNRLIKNKVPHIQDVKISFASKMKGYTAAKKGGITKEIGENQTNEKIVKEKEEEK